MTDPAPPPVKSKRAKSLKPWHFTAIQYALTGRDYSEVARLLGKKRQVVSAFLNTEFAQKAIADFHASVTERLAQDRIDPLRVIHAAVPRALEKLIAKLDCGDDKTEFLAACRLLDNAGMSPVKRLHVSEDEKLRDLSLEEMKRFAITGELPARLQIVDATVAQNGKVHEG